VKYLQRAHRSRVLARQRRVVSGYADVITQLAPATDRKVLVKPLTMVLFGMINWTFTWFNERGPLQYADLAPLVADLFLGGIGRVRACRAPPAPVAGAAPSALSSKPSHERRLPV
jgi:hypothetical protein